MAHLTEDMLRSVFYRFKGEKGHGVSVRSLPPTTEGDEPRSSNIRVCWCCGRLSCVQYGLESHCGEVEP
jgi:hypothetical protein